MCAFCVKYRHVEMTVKSEVWIPRDNADAFRPFLKGSLRFGVSSVQICGTIGIAMWRCMCLWGVCDVCVNCMQEINIFNYIKLKEIFGSTHRSLYSLAAGINCRHKNYRKNENCGNGRWIIVKTGDKKLVVRVRIMTCVVRFTRRCERPSGVNLTPPGK